MSIEIEGRRSKSCCCLLLLSAFICFGLFGLVKITAEISIVHASLL